jgi:hypothetical protein
MKTKQTAVEWLIEQFQEQNTPRKWKEIIEQAKAMEKEQIIDANIAGQMFIAACPGHYKNDAEDYYKETFKQD